MTVKAIQHRYNVNHALTDPQGKYTSAGVANIVSNVMLVALFTIGILTAAGTLSTWACGWSAIGLGSGALVTQFLGGKLKIRKVDLFLSTLFAAGAITIGALGCVGILPGPLVGVSLISILGAEALLYMTCCRAYEAHKVHQQAHHSP